MTWTAHEDTGGTRHHSATGPPRDLTAHLSEWPPPKSQQMASPGRTWSTGDLVLCGEQDQVQPLWGTVWQCFQKAKNRTAPGPHTPLPGAPPSGRRSAPRGNACAPTSITAAKTRSTARPRKGPAIRDAAEGVVLREIGHFHVLAGARSRWWSRGLGQPGGCRSGCEMGRPRGLTHGMGTTGLSPGHLLVRGPLP